MGEQGGNFGTGGDLMIGHAIEHLVEAASFFAMFGFLTSSDVGAGVLGRQERVQ
jgi:hypothetical protein